MVCRGVVAIVIRAHCVQFHEECKPAEETGLSFVQVVVVVVAKHLCIKGFWSITRAVLHPWLLLYGRFFFRFNLFECMQSRNASTVYFIQGPCLYLPSRNISWCFWKVAFDVLPFVVPICSLPFAKGIVALCWSFTCPASSNFPVWSQVMWVLRFLQIKKASVYSPSMNFYVISVVMYELSVSGMFTFCLRLYSNFSSSTMSAWDPSLNYEQVPTSQAF